MLANPEEAKSTRNAKTTAHEIHREIIMSSHPILSLLHTVLNFTVPHANDFFVFPRPALNLSRLRKRQFTPHRWAKKKSFPFLDGEELRSFQSDEDDVQDDLPRSMLTHSEDRVFIIIFPRLSSCLETASVTIKQSHSAHTPIVIQDQTFFPLKIR